MKTVGTLEAKTNLSKLLDEVEAGGEIIITRHGKPVARVAAYDQQAAQRAAWERFFATARKMQTELPPGETIKDLINAGRKN